MEESQDIQNQNNITTQKKRGRPRKNLLENNKNTEKKKIQTDLSQQREIILHLPIQMKQVSNESNKKSTSESEKNDTTLVIKNADENVNNNTILTISDNIENCYESDNDNENVDELLEQLKTKEKIIKKLRDELCMYKQNASDNFTMTATREHKYIPIDVKLVDNNSGKTIIAEKTNIVCWWCTYNFDSIPCFIPEKHDNDKYYVFGCFCTLNCAVSYNLNMGDYKIYDRYSLIKKMYQNMYDINEEILIAPSREVLEKFGGPLTITEFRKNFKHCNKEYKLLMPPMIPSIPYVEERNREKSIINKNDTNRYDKKTKNVTIFDTFTVGR
ncbi:hypothetical protein Catovirus_2_292 [Catovirus CTV1]|uniref:MYM-type domain-containing protein n=1 Tax=Catovirus CTV1 TaxID=1977631 RepID=A0A1V0SCA1_9VIRU|nr:hypothetical protein Catovirus_2_292 [Catovirus CTV1]